eukprot:1648563-Prymnesium_polylepis.2
MLLSSFWPLVLLLILFGGCVGAELAQSCRIGANAVAYRPASSTLVRKGLKRALPIGLVVTFVLVPSTSTVIFKTFLCDSFEYDDSTGQTQRYMHDDLTSSCNTQEYDTTRHAARVMVAVWPVGCVAVYALLLWASRDAIRAGGTTSMSVATEFLWADCMPAQIKPKPT